MQMRGPSFKGCHGVKFSPILVDGYLRMHRDIRQQIKSNNGKIIHIEN